MLDSEIHPTLTGLLSLSTMTLATCRPEANPHAAPVYFAAGHGYPPALYFFSDPESQHGRDLSQNPNAAAACYPECRGWQDIRGLQMRGEARLVERGTEWDAAWACYTAKFPFVNKLKAIVARNALYVFKPSWIRLVDNRQSFGFKQEWTFP